MGGVLDARVHATAEALVAALAGPEGLGARGEEERRAACGALGAAMRAAPTAAYPHVHVRRLRLRGGLCSAHTSHRRARACPGGL